MPKLNTSHQTLAYRDEKINRSKSQIFPITGDSRQNITSSVILRSIMNGPLYTLSYLSCYREWSVCTGQVSLVWNEGPLPTDSTWMRFRVPDRAKLLHLLKGQHSTTGGSRTTTRVICGADSNQGQRNVGKFMNQRTIISDWFLGRL